jgi:hypothetical protein
MKTNKVTRIACHDVLVNFNIDAKMEKGVVMTVYLKKING